MDDFGYTKESNFENIADAIRSKNGTDNTYTPSEMASAIEELKVGELDFKDVFNQEQADRINQYYKDGIAHAKEIEKNWDDVANMDNKFRFDLNLIFLPKVTFNNATSLVNTFRDSGLQSIKGDYLDLPKVTSMTNFASNSSLRKIIINAPVVNRVINWFSGMSQLEYVEVISSIENLNTFTNMAYSCYGLSVLKLKYWKQGDLPLYSSFKLSVESIDYLIQNAMDVADGATDRTLTLHETAGANWDANSKYQGEERNLILTQKGIEVTW